MLLNKNKIFVYLSEQINKRRTDLFHVLDLVREKKWSNEEIIEALLIFYKEDLITFAYEGDYIHTNPSKWTDEEWEEGQIKGTLRNSFLRSLYALGFKKKELEDLRFIMQTIYKRTGERVRPEWGFFYVETEKWWDRPKVVGKADKVVCPNCGYEDREVNITDITKCPKCGGAKLSIVDMKVGGRENE